MAKKTNKAVDQEIKLTQVEIAALAYKIFHQEGCPHGRDLDHWLEAERHLTLNQKTFSEKKSFKN